MPFSLALPGAREGVLLHLVTLIRNINGIFSVIYCDNCEVSDNSDAVPLPTALRKEAVWCLKPPDRAAA